MSNDFQIGVAEIFPREAGSNSIVADYKIICFNAYWIMLCSRGRVTFVWNITFFRKIINQEHKERCHVGKIYFALTGFVKVYRV